MFVGQRWNALTMSHKRWWLLPALLLTGVLAMTDAAATPVTFNTALPVSRDEAVVRIQAKSLRATDDSGPMNRKLAVDALPLVVGWGLSARWTLFGIVPLLDKRLRVSLPAGHVTRGVRGVGDVTAMLRYTVYQNDQLGRTFRIAPFAALEMPSGKDDERDSLGHLPATLQLGSGSWDSLIGIVTTVQSLKTEWGLSTDYKFNRQANGFQLGDEARIDLSYHRRIAAYNIAGSGPCFLYAGLEDNLVWQNKNHSGGVNDNDSGGTTLYFAPTLQYVTMRTVTGLAVQTPVIQQLNGDALEQDFIATLSLRVNF